MAVGTYRARSGTEIIDAAFQLVKSHYAPLVTITAIGFLPLLTLELLTGGAGGERPSMLPLIFGIINAITTLIMQGALIFAIANAYRGIPIDIAQSLRMGVSKLRRMFNASFASGFLTSIAFILLIIPGLFVFAWLFVVPVIAVLEENIPVMATLSRSRELCRDHKRRVFAYMGILLAVYIICIVIIGVLAAIIRSPMLGAFAGITVFVLGWPLYPAFMVLHYFDARIRKEGYDVELLAQAMGSPVSSPSMPESASA